MWDNEKTYNSGAHCFQCHCMNYILRITPLSASLLQESLEEQRLEKFTALHGIKQLKSLLEGLKERVAKKPVHKSKVRTWLAYTHTCSTCAHRRMYVRTYVHMYTPTHSLNVSLMQPIVSHTHTNTQRRTHKHTYMLMLFIVT